MKRLIGQNVIVRGYYCGNWIGTGGRAFIMKKKPCKTPICMTVKSATGRFTIMGITGIKEIYK